MLERMVLSLTLAVTAVMLYQASRWWMVRRVRQHGTYDPILGAFVPGRPAVLYFTAEHCAACKLQQHPALENLQKQSDVQVIQIDTDKYPSDAQRWGVMSLPTTFILDAEGKPQSVNYGVTSTQKLRLQLENAHKPKDEVHGN